MVLVSTVDTLSGYGKGRKVRTSIDNDGLSLWDGGTHPNMNIVSPISLRQRNTLISIKLSANERR